MKTVAVIGASTDRSKFGNKAVRAFREAGYTVIPITPKHAEVEGLTAYPSVRDVPGDIDMATVYVPASAGVQVMEDLAARNVPEIWLNPGADDPAVVQHARSLGLTPIEACSIVGIGYRPGRF